MVEAPTQSELLSRVMDARLADLHTALPGIVESYNVVTQLATVRPAIRRPGGEEMPAIQNVPVLWPRAGTGYLVLPMGPGDSVLLVFCERDFRLWRERGESGEPGDVSLHGLNGAVAIPGFYPRGSTVGQPHGQVALLSCDEVRLGDESATKHVPCGEKLNAAILAWAGAVSVAISGLGGDVTGALTTLTNALPNTLSPSVTVED